MPGIGGSELIDPATEETVWGLRTTRANVKGLLTGAIVEHLRPDRNLRPNGAIRFKTFLPGFGRFDPYTRLEHALREFCVHSDAYATFAYDWRQPVAVAGEHLAEFAHAHLERWRQINADARLNLVCHSMGGLVATHGIADLVDKSSLGLDDIGMVLTLGTPFGGSVKAVKAINDGTIAPRGVHAHKISTLCKLLPSVHDLLPSYPALTADPAKPGATQPTIDDLIAIGSDADLTKDAVAARSKRSLHQLGTKLRCRMGTGQPTLLTYTRTGTNLAYHRLIDGHDWGGDGTVYSGSAYPGSHPSADPIPQQHGSLAKTDEGIAWVIATLQHTTLGPPQGIGIGLAVDDTCETNEALTIEVTYSDGRIDGAFLTITDMSGDKLPAPQLNRRDDMTDAATIAFNRPGLYTTTVTGGGYSPVSVDTLVLAKPK